MTKVKKKTTLHVQHLFVHLFAIVSTTIHVMQEMLCVPTHFFWLPHIFTFVAPSISHFLTAAVKFWCFSSNEIGLRCWVFLALALSWLSTLMWTLKFSRTKDSAFLLLLLFFSLCLSLKVPVAMWFTTEKSGVLEMQSFTPAYMKGWTYVRKDDFVRTKISWMHR